MTPARYVAPPLAWKSPQTSNVELRAPPASQPSPPASIHSSAKAKETDPTHSQRSSPDIRATPGGIIPEWWARINRNAGRQLIGMGGRHHPGIGGRLAPESAMVALRLFLPESWTSDAARLKRAGVPVDYRAAQTKPEIALEFLGAGHAIPPAG